MLQLHQCWMLPSICVVTPKSISNQTWTTETWSCGCLLCSLCQEMELTPNSSESFHSLLFNVRCIHDHMGGGEGLAFCSCWHTNHRRWIPWSTFVVVTLFTYCWEVAGLISKNVCTRLCGTVSQQGNQSWESITNSRAFTFSTHTQSQYFVLRLLLLWTNLFTFKMLYMPVLKIINFNACQLSKKYFFGLIFITLYFIRAFITFPLSFVYLPP
jgi:hypothetical protein